MNRTKSSSQNKHVILRELSRNRETENKYKICKTKKVLFRFFFLSLKHCAKENGTLIVLHRWHCQSTTRFNEAILSLFLCLKGIFVGNEEWLREIDLE